MKLSERSAGSSVYLNVNGYKKEFIVAHQGKPSAMYDDSCNGTWLFMAESFGKYAWGSNCSPSFMPIYESSDVHSAVNVSFVNLLDADIKNAIKSVKIPIYCEGSIITSGCLKAFILSSTEMGLEDNGQGDGACLDFFRQETVNSMLALYFAYYDDTSLRTPYDAQNQHLYATVDTSYSTPSISYSSSNPETPHNVHPVIILPGTLSVSGSGDVVTNTAPSITSSVGNGSDMGTKSAGFSFNYTVSDADGDTLTVTEKLDGKVKRSFTASSGTSNTFEATNAAHFQTVQNGRHTLTVSVSDGSDITEYSVTFTKAVHSASITLAASLTVAGDITASVMSLLGSIPSDAALKIEVTNNANDASPSWQDVTDDVKNGRNFIFNKTASNGAAFNFRITVSRGSSGEGGYISSVSGAFK